MPSANVYDMDGNVVREEQLDAYVFGAPMNVGLLHQVVTSQLVNRRQGNADTKTRSDVSGGGKKPYRQKGTGRARQGSPRAPQWRTGGTVFGPQPHTYERKVPRKMRRLAIRAALSDKATNGRILLMDEIAFETPQTRQMQTLLENLPLERHVLLLMPERDENVILSARNLRQIKLGHVDSTNVVEILKYDHLLMPMQTVERLVEMFGEAADDTLQMKRHPLVVARRQARRAAAQSAAAAAAAATSITKAPARKSRAAAGKPEAAEKPEVEGKPEAAEKPARTRRATAKAEPAEPQSKPAGRRSKPAEPESKSSERSTGGKGRSREE
jgi:large subunit ribosomal protein L4